MSVKKLLSYDTPIRFYGRKSKKSLDFEKLELKMRSEYSDRNPIFGVKLFFQEPLENFLWTLQPCLRYLKGAPSVALYASKKIMTVRHANQKLWTET